MAEVSLSEVIAPAFYDIHKLIKQNAYNHYWEKGGRGSCKSSFISIEIILNLIKDPNAHAICFRKVGKFLETSVYNQIKWAIDKLGLKPYFRFYKSPLRIEYIRTGQLILFMGLDDPDKARSIKLPFGYIKIGWFEELNQFDGMKEVREVIRSFLRGGDDALIFYSYNPPEEINNWVNLESTKEVDNRHVHHTTYLEVDPDWLGKTFILEAEMLKENAPQQYKHAYLGEVVGTGLNVFKNVQARIFTQEELKRFDRINEGIDWGFAVDPFVFTKNYLNRKHRTLYIFDEIYEVGLSNPEAIKKVKAKHTAGTEIIADSEEPKSIYEFSDAGLPIKKTRKGAGSISYGIKKLQGLFKIYIDPQRCPNTYREFINYSLVEDRSGNIKSQYPDKDNHTIDATRYSLEDEFSVNV